MKIGIALGGGGARGIAHIGVLKVLEREKIPIDFIAGTSMGAIIGAMYSQNPSAHSVINRIQIYLESNDYKSLGIKHFVPRQVKAEKTLSFLQFLYKGLWERFSMEISSRRSGLLKKNRLEEALKILLNQGNIEDTAIPFAAVATDISSGKTVVIREGDIRKAVRISASIPGIVPPEIVEESVLVDGGVTEPVPVHAVRKMGADFVIAVSVNVKELNPLKNPNIIDIITRAETIRGNILSSEIIKDADFLFYPDLKDAHWSEFMRYYEFIEAGIKEAEEKIDELKKVLKKRKSLWRRIWKRQ